MINMLFYILSAFSLATFGLLTTGESTLPLTTCKRNSVYYSACLKHFLEEAWPQIFPGLPELNFPSLDPLIYKNGKAVFNSGDIHGKLTLSNVITHGLSKTRFYGVKTHFLDDTFRLEIDIQIPKIFINGFAKMNGTISIFKIINEGYFNLTVDDVRGTWDLTGSVVNDTWIVEHFISLPSIGKLKLYLDDSYFQDNKQLNYLVTTFINEFWPSLYRVLLPTLSNLWEPFLVNSVSNIFLKIPFSKLFP